MLSKTWGCRISMVIFMEHLFYFRIFEEVLLCVVGMMASRLLCGVGARASQAPRVRGPKGVTMGRSVTPGSGVPTDDEQMTGLEREVIIAAWKGLDLYNMLAP